MVDIQANTFICLKSSIKKSTCHWRKFYRWLSLLIIINLFSKRNGLQGWLYYWSLYPSEKNLPAEKRYIDEWDWYSIQKHVETGPKVSCFAGFCHHHLTTINAYTPVYCYSSFESVTNTSVRMIASCRKDKVLLSRHK